MDRQEDVRDTRIVGDEEGCDQNYIISRQQNVRVAEFVGNIGTVIISEVRLMALARACVYKPRAVTIICLGITGDEEALSK